MMVTALTRTFKSCCVQKAMPLRFLKGAFALSFRCAYGYMEWPWCPADVLVAEQILHLLLCCFWIQPLALCPVHHKSQKTGMLAFLYGHQDFPPEISYGSHQTTFHFSVERDKLLGGPFLYS